MVASAHELPTSSEQDPDRSYVLFVSEPEDPTYGVLLEEDKSPNTKRSLSACAELLVNFEEGEAHSPADRGISRQLKQSLREYCQTNDLDYPNAAIETGRYDQTDIGNWNGDWHSMVEDVWGAFHSDGSSRETIIGSIRSCIPEHSPDFRSDGGSDQEEALPKGVSERYKAATSPIGTDWGEVDRITR